MSEKIDATELAAWLAQSTGPIPFLLDVREEWEWDLARIEGAVLIPMREIPDRLDKLPQDRPIVTICHHGVRSLHVARYLAQTGYQEVMSLKGGVEAWASLVDPTVPHY